MATNYKFTTYTTKLGKVYQVPVPYKDLTVSQIIRNMVSDGYTKYQIHKVTEIRYQHIRNVLLTPLVGTK